jgi:hypothetical protein
VLIGPIAVETAAMDKGAVTKFWAAFALFGLARIVAKRCDKFRMQHSPSLPDASHARPSHDRRHACISLPSSAPSFLHSTITSIQRRSSGRLKLLLPLNFFTFAVQCLHLVHWPTNFTVLSAARLSSALHHFEHLTGCTSV